MKMQKVLKIIIFSLILTASGSFCHQAFADYTLSCTPDVGGTRLEFDERYFSHTVTVTITNDTGNGYEIHQRIDGPLVSHENPSDKIEKEFVVRGFRSSENLRVPTDDTAVIDNKDMVLYISRTGNADSFTLVYSIAKSQELAPGHYTGRINLILIPTAGSAPMPPTQPFEVYVTIPDDGSSPLVSVAPAEGASSIVINPSDTNDLRGAGNAVVTINNPSNKPFSIKQLLLQPIQFENGKTMDNQNLLFSIPDARKGVTTYQQPSPISNNIQAIYASGADGSADKTFTIAYSLADPLSLTAGNYHSRIQYFLESAGTQTNLRALDLEIRQERIFEISISPQDQRYSIDFADLKPSDGPRLNEVLIEVKSNLGRPYQVTQNVLSELVSAEGEKIPPQYFSLQTLSVDNTKGDLKVASKIPVEKGNVLLFISDANGSADKFKVIYELICPADLRAGNYSSRITYTLTEI